MIKDTFFSSSRFMQLCRKDMVENWRTNLHRIVMLYGIMAVIFTVRGYFKYKFVSQTDPLVEYSLNSFLVFMCIFGCLQASVTFDKMKTKTSRLSALMTPATPFEKYFSGWLISTIVFILVMTLTFLLADYTRVLVCGLLYPEATIIPARLSYLLTGGAGAYHTFPTKEILGYSVVTYFFFQSFFLLGSAVWPKNSFVKTFGAGLLITISYLLVAAGSIYLFWMKNSFRALNFMLNGGDNIMLGIVIFFTLFNWVMAYFRLKESEIINKM